MITVNHTIEHYIESADDYIEVDLTCEVEIEGVDPSVGIMRASAELQSAVDDDGKDWHDKLTVIDIESIEIKALDDAEEKAREMRSIPRQFRSKYAELV